MKPSVSITLILTGVLLILTPVITGCIFATTAIMNNTHHFLVNLPGLEYGYTWTCMAIGALMIGATMLANRSTR